MAIVDELIARIDAAKKQLQDASTVLEGYRVQDDRLTDWKPNLGFLPIRLPVDSVEITETEARMLDNLGRSGGIRDLLTIRGIREHTIGESENQFPQSGNIPAHVPNNRQGEWINSDGHRDAFRHAYLNSLLTREFGEEWTSQFATAHEALPGNPPDREAMDLYNNEVGRRIAVDNPDASGAELAQLIRQATNNGELVVLDQNGEPAWSNEVPEWQHGLDTSEPEEGGQPVPNGNASAEQPFDFGWGE